MNIKPSWKEYFHDREKWSRKKSIVSAIRWVCDQFCSICTSLGKLPIISGYEFHILQNGQYQCHVEKNKQSGYKEGST